MQQGFSSFSFSQLNISNLFLITEYNECASNPCQFGGICNDRVNRFECQCPFARVGTRCGKFLNCMKNFVITDNTSVEIMHCKIYFELLRCIKLSNFNFLKIP